VILVTETRIKVRLQAEGLATGQNGMLMASELARRQSALAFADIMWAIVGMLIDQSRLHALELLAILDD
jgi:hypothetical protein